LTVLRFIHTADLHLDSPFKGMRHFPKQQVNEIYESTFRSFDQIVNHCIEKKVDFLLIAGDVYDSHEQSLRAKIHLRKGLEKLDAVGIYTYIIHGNHDPLKEKENEIKWPNKVHFFSQKQVETISFYRENIEIARILGRSYPKKSFMENIVKDFKRVDSNVFHIGLLHTNVDGQKGHDSYCPSRLQELIWGEMDYWALGHIHKRAVLHNQSPYIVYPGNTQGRHSLETGDKGCYYVEVEDNEVKMIEWLSTASIRWESLDIDVSSIESASDLISMIETEVEEMLIQNQLPIIYRVNLKGRTPLHTLLSEGYQQFELIDILNNELSNRQPWSLIESIKVRTQPFISKEAILEQGTFFSEYIKQFEKTFSELDMDYLQLEVLPELFKHRGFKKHFDRLTLEEIDELKEQVLSYAYEFLMEKE